MITSPLRYPGGKSKAIKAIAPLIPDFDEFREPFVGGGSVFIYLKQKYPDKSFWINDLYYELFKFWEVSQRKLDKVVEQVLKWRKEYNEGKKLHRYLIDNILRFNDVQIAAAFFVLNRITFSGTSESGGFSQQAFEKRFTYSSIERLSNLKNVLNDTLVTNYDYQKVMEEDGENVFIFLDPPYFSTKKSALYGKNGNLHKVFDHDRFAEVMKNCKHNWLITYDDDSYIRKLFSFAKIFTWELTYGMRNVTDSSKQKQKEIFVSNYLYDLQPEKQIAMFNEPKVKYIPL